MSHALMGPYWDVALPVARRMDDLVSRLSLAKKVGRMLHEAPALGRLGLGEYNGWNECLHGVTGRTLPLSPTGGNAYHAGCVLGGVRGA